VLAGLGVLLALVLVFWEGYARYRSKVTTPRFARKHVAELVVAVVVLAVFGARIGHLWYQWGWSAVELGRIIRFWYGGLVFHGGLGGALVAVVLYRAVRAVPLRHMLDMIAPYVAVGYALGRIGCFVNECCAGQGTELLWGVAFPGLLDEQLRHPTQLYAALVAVVIFVLMRVIYRKAQAPGATLGAFFLLFGGYRFLMEFLRLHRPEVGWLSPFQWAALAMIALGLALLIAAKVHGKTYHEGG